MVQQNHPAVGVYSGEQFQPDIMPSRNRRIEWAALFVIKVKEETLSAHEEDEAEGCSRPAAWLPLRSCTLHTQNCSGKKLPRSRQMHTENLID